ncbi:hypothetical protein OG596_26985 [Streptomyces sp. NBC_01102]|uniref:hypothetical protein n=1 Tax=Streptomyces sp. NBC_01102 TaxID=2903749 RepID=UPI003870743C|nr:hypothetical protein OG596_26985 [Streptomyces sp. NBC_01102]
MPALRTIAHITAFPAKGTPDRRIAMLAYGLLATAVFTTLATATLPNDTPAAVKTQGVKKADAFAIEAVPGYMPTLLDGGGGIAGVPLTEGQRKAITVKRCVGGTRPATPTPWRTGTTLSSTCGRTAQSR